MEDFNKMMYFQLLIAKGLTSEEVDKILSDGNYICPICLQVFKPKFKTKEKAETNGIPEDIEQHLSHICSTKCWNKMSSFNT